LQAPCAATGVELLLNPVRGLPALYEARCENLPGQDQPVDGAADIVDLGVSVAGGVEDAGFGLDLDLAALHAVREARNRQGLVGNAGPIWSDRQSGDATPYPPMRPVDGFRVG
jgi:hypothetical protein